ncbi:MAG TPA: glycoside hydrolase family 9 protein [Saprospiraceae bacterium]|nr:glycoside hydrolase family 9 protein [Saprospiraceae bacterium]
MKILPFPLPGWSIIFFLVFFIHQIPAQRLARDLQVEVMINQGGYLPQSSKQCQIPGSSEKTFEVVEVTSRQVVYKGTTTAAGTDLGMYTTGDFSSLARPGHYYVRADTLRSYPFEISSQVYRNPQDLIFSYFSKQRCGGSATGYMTPCHLDDGIRMDNGKHMNVTGGWHDASDLRKWVGATIYGMLGLVRAYEKNEARQAGILEELKWGNQYFLAMQEPEGYVMSFIGGDVEKHSDSNRWTDNETGPEEGELKMVRPNAGTSMADMLIRGNKDDRIIRTDPLDLTGQFNFITAEALMAGITKKTDRAYSARCLAAAQNCFQWCIQKDYLQNPGVIGAALQAALELHKVTGDKQYLDFAIALASDLKAYQAKGEPGGFFYDSDTSQTPYHNIWNGCQHLIALCDLALAFPKHPDRPAWLEMIDAYTRDYLVPFTRKNAFGIVPLGLFQNPEKGGRQAGKYSYRYFMYPEKEWWVGINSNLASAGVGLFKAAGILQDENLKTLAQRQLDWILGANPFNSSTLVGLGYNHPKHFPGSTFLPRTPVIPGAVMNGLGGDEEDRPVIGDGWWQVSEYWTPMVAYTLWLLVILG